MKNYGKYERKYETPYAEYREKTYWVVNEDDVKQINYVNCYVHGDGDTM